MNTSSELTSDVLLVSAVMLAPSCIYVPHMSMNTPDHNATLCQSVLNQLLIVGWAGPTVNDLRSLCGSYIPT